MPLILTFRRQRQEDLCELKTSQANLVGVSGVVDRLEGGGWAVCLRLCIVPDSFRVTAAPLPHLP